MSALACTAAPNAGLEPHPAVAFVAAIFPQARVELSGSLSDPGSIATVVAHQARRAGAAERPATLMRRSRSQSVPADLVSFSTTTTGRALIDPVHVLRAFAPESQGVGAFLPDASPDVRELKEHLRLVALHREGLAPRLVVDMTYCPSAAPGQQLRKLRLTTGSPVRLGELANTLSIQAKRLYAQQQIQAIYGACGPQFLGDVLRESLRLTASDCGASAETLTQLLLTARHLDEEQAAQFANAMHCALV